MKDAVGEIGLEGIWTQKSLTRETRVNRVTTVGNFLAQVTWALACCLPFSSACSFNQGKRRKPDSCKLTCCGISKLFCVLGLGGAKGPKSSHLLLAAASSAGAVRRVFNFKLAAAFNDEDTLADARLFPPLETCVMLEFLIT